MIQYSCNVADLFLNVDVERILILRRRSSSFILVLNDINYYGQWMNDSFIECWMFIANADEWMILNDECVIIVIIIIKKPMMCCPMITIFIIIYYRYFHLSLSVCVYECIFIYITIGFIYLVWILLKWCLFACTCVHLKIYTFHKISTEKANLYPIFLLAFKLMNHPFDVVLMFYELLILYLGKYFPEWIKRKEEKFLIASRWRKKPFQFDWF